jgi:hypothetical protein
VVPKHARRPNMVVLPNSSNYIFSISRILPFEHLNIGTDSTTVVNELCG